MTHGWYLGQLGEQDSGRVELRATQQVCHVRIYSLHDKEEDHRYQTDIMSSGVQISYPDPQIHRWYHGSMVLVWYLPIWGMDGYPPHGIYWMQDGSYVALCLCTAQYALYIQGI